MKSPFLVAAQLQASSSEFRGEYDGDDEVDSRTTPLKKRGAASTTSNGNGNGNGNGLLSPVPIPPSSAKTLPSSTGRKNGRPTSTPTTINGTTSKRKAVNSSDGRTALQATPPPSLDQLPGSRLSMSSPSSNGSALQQAPYTSGTTTPSSLRAIATANAHANGKLAGIVPRARSVRALERQRKAKQRSNLILLASALPIAAVVLYDYLYPATAHLSTLHTRTPAWHLSSIPSKCLHLSYQIPSSTDALLNNFSSSSSYSSSRPLSDSHNTISTLTLLRNALSTAPTTARFLKGPDDIFVVLLWISFFTCFRESLIRFVFAPIGRLGGLRKNGALLRFGEQGYDVASHTLAVLFGFCIMQAKDSGYRNLDIDGLWIGYPHYKLPGSLKFYYLMQEGFWLQQFLTIHLEKKRKDYRQMLTHHFITVSLLYLSYIYNFTRIGNVILILMDVSDIVLGIAKMQKYLGFENLCDVSFGLFMLSWIVTRHILYVRVLASVIWDSKKFIHFEWAPEKEYFWSENTKAVFVTLLSTLQILLILWFGMIVKVAVAVLRGKPAEDTRSDEDDASETTVDGRASGSSTPKRVSSNGNGHANGHAYANANGGSVKFTPNGNGNGYGNGQAVGNQNKVTSNGYHVNNGGMTSSRTTASSTPSTTGRKKKQT